MYYHLLYTSYHITNRTLAIAMVPITPTPRALPGPGELFILNGKTYVDPGDGMHHPRVAPWTLKAILLDPAYPNVRQKLDCWFYFAQLLHYDIRLPEHADTHSIKDQLIRKAILGRLEVPFDVVVMEKRDRERRMEEEIDGEREPASPPRGNKRKANDISTPERTKRRKIQNIEDDLEDISAFSSIPVHLISTGSSDLALQVPTQYASCVPLPGSQPASLEGGPGPFSTNSEIRPKYGNNPLKLSPHSYRHRCTCNANGDAANGCPNPSGRFAITSPSTLSTRDIYVVKTAAGNIHWASFSFGAFEVLLQFGRGDLLRWTMRRERRKRRSEREEWKKRYLYASGYGYVIEFGIGERVRFWLDGFCGRVKGGKGLGLEIEGFWREEGIRVGMSDAQMRREWKEWRGEMTEKNRLVQVEV